MVDRGLLFATLSGGECTLVPDFPQIYRFLKEHGVVTTIFTNGCNISERILQLWQELPPATVEVSLYSPNTESAAYRTIERLKSLGIRVLGKVTVTTVTRNVLEPAKRWCNEMGINFIHDAELFAGDNGVDVREYRLSQDERTELLAETNSRQRKSIKTYTAKRKEWYECNAGSSGFYISPKYTLSTCYVSPREWSLSGGFIPAYEQMVSYIAEMKGRRLEGCTGCTYHDLCTVCGPALERRFGIDADCCVTADMCEKIKRRFEYLSE